MSTAAAAPQTSTSTWNVDPVHSVVEFKVKHMMISNVKGHFSSLTGTLSLDEARPENSSVQASIEVASINTRDPQRDGHLKSADFFDAEKFPTIDFKDPWGNTRVGVTASTKISRKDFGLTWNAALETGGVLVGDEVTIALDVQFVKAA
jgi:polyisoprenoid-binding protein YceI